MRRFEGKVAAITGAASGIGRATAVRLAAEGAHVACLDVAADGAEATVAAITAKGGQAFALTCDVSDRDAIAAAIAATVSTAGRLDVLCNIAGLGHFVDDREETLEGWNRVIGINLTGTFLVSQAALPHLVETRGNIVNTASTAALKGQPWSAAYSASKGGVVSLTQTMAIDWGKQGVRVNCVAPGGVETPITSQFNPPEGADLALLQRIMPFDRSGQPDELAAAFAYLASDDASYVNGIVLRVDGGMQA
jgi:meso-butanediol dehydrogenase/(S,S)-butanediol dehydrogenase/diacetyl reductase